MFTWRRLEIYLRVKGRFKFEGIFQKFLWCFFFPSVFSKGKNRVHILFSHEANPSVRHSLWWSVSTERQVHKGGQRERLEAWPFSSRGCQCVRERLGAFKKSLRLYEQLGAFQFSLLWCIMCFFFLHCVNLCWWLCCLIHGASFFFFGFVFVSLLHCSDGHKEWEVFSSVVFTTVVADALLKIICQYFQLIFSGEYKQDHSSRFKHRLWVCISVIVLVGKCPGSGYSFVAWPYINFGRSKDDIQVISNCAFAVMF